MKSIPFKELMLTAVLAIALTVMACGDGLGPAQTVTINPAPEVVTIPGETVVVEVPEPTITVNWTYVDAVGYFWTGEYKGADVENPVCYVNWAICETCATTSNACFVAVASALGIGNGIRVDHVDLL